MSERYNYLSLHRKAPYSNHPHVTPLQHATPNALGPVTVKAPPSVTPPATLAMSLSPPVKLAQVPCLL